MSSTIPMLVRSIFFYVAMFIMAAFICCHAEAKKMEQISPAPGTPIPFDSIEKDRIDTLVKHINDRLPLAGLPKKLAYPKYTVEDTIYYWQVDSNSARISIEFNAPEEIIWPTFFVDQGKLVFVRFRYHSSAFPQPFAMESYIYLKDGKIVHCVERSMKMDASQRPGTLKQFKHVKTTRTYEEVEKDYKEIWDTTVEYMKEHHQFPFKN